MILIFGGLSILMQQIIKLKRQALELSDRVTNENNANTLIEQNLYNEAVEKFPELSNMSKEHVLSEVKKALTVNKQEVKEEEDIPTRKIFIDHVLCNDTKFNDAEVRDHVYTIVAAGSETTALQTAHTSTNLLNLCKALATNLIYSKTFRLLSHASRDKPRNSGQSCGRTERSFLLRRCRD